MPPIDLNRPYSLIWAFWRIHAQLCTCRASDFPRCALATEIRRITPAVVRAADLRRARIRPPGGLGSTPWS